MHEVEHVGTPLPPAMERQMEAAAVDLAKRATAATVASGTR